MDDSTRARQAAADAQDKINESKDRAVSAASDAADTVRDVAQQKMAEARSTLESKASDVRGTIESKATEARDTAKHRAESGISDAASGLKDTAHRLRDVSNDLDEKDRWLGATLEQAANVADRAGGYLSGQSLNDVVGDAQRVARRNPAAFMGGAAALGFALARVGKVTADRADLGGSNGRSAYSSNGQGGVNRAATRSQYERTVSTVSAGTPATGALDSTHAPTPGGMNTGTAAPASAAPVTRPTDGRDLNPIRSTPMHGSQT